MPFFAFFFLFIFVWAVYIPSLFSCAVNLKTKLVQGYSMYGVHSHSIVHVSHMYTCAGLERVHGFTFGDSLGEGRKEKWLDFNAKLNKVRSINYV